MEHLSLSTVALGLTTLWEVGDVQFDAEAGRIRPRGGVPAQNAVYLFTLWCGAPAGPRYP